MPDISPATDGGYNYYKREVDALEEELKRERTRAQSKEDQLAARTEENRKAENLRNAEQLAHTIDAVKEDSSSEITRERKNAQAEVDRQKALNYDRFGRSNGLEADALKLDLDTANRAFDAQRDLYHRQIDTADKSHAMKLSAGIEAANDQIEKSTRLTRDEGAASYDKLNLDRRTELENTKRDYQNRYAETSARLADDTAVIRSEAARGLADAKADTTRQLARAEATATEKTHQAVVASDEKMARNAREMTDSHTNETALLREKTQALTATQGTYQKERGQATQDVTREMESEWMNRQKNTEAAYEGEIESLKHKANESESYFNRLNNQTHKDKDAYFAGVVAAQAGENRKREQTLTNDYERDFDQLKAQTKRDRLIAADTQSRKMDMANARMNDALERQAKTNQESNNRQKQSEESQAKDLRKEIAFKNSDDLSAISPALEGRLREQIGNAYEKDEKAQGGRNKASEAHIYESMSQRVREVVTEKDHANAAQQMQQEATRQFEKSQFLDHLSDMEHSTSAALRNKDLSHEKESGQLNRNYATTLEKQRREYEEMIDVLRTDASSKLIAMRQESDFNSKMAQRAFAGKQNELIRENDKKLADQKILYEDQLEQLRSQTQNVVQDSERRVRGALEEQGRSYEQRMAQIEAQHKERERYTAQSYEDQLDKVRRTNALLQQKKS